MKIVCEKNGGSNSAGILEQPVEAVAVFENGRIMLIGAKAMKCYSSFALYKKAQEIRWEWMWDKML